MTVTCHRFPFLAARSISHRLALCLALCFLATAVRAAQPLMPTQAEHVDLELVLAVDVSLSMDMEEQRLQRQGYVDAFRDKDVIAAIQSGPNRRIAVTYLEWAGYGSHTVVIPWRVIDGSEAAHLFAADLSNRPISRARRTSISGGIERGSALFQENGVTGLRRVIDVSGDGPNNSGPPVETARDTAVEAGVVINGLALLFNTGGNSWFDVPDLDRYYAACVIGGPGSFMIPVTEVEMFSTAIRQKLLLEIAWQRPEQGIGSPSPLHRIQWQPEKPTYDCLVGEKRWREFMQDRWGE